MMLYEIARTKNEMNAEARYAIFLVCENFLMNKNVSMRKQVNIIWGNPNFAMGKRFVQNIVTRLNASDCFFENPSEIPNSSIMRANMLAKKILVKLAKNKSDQSEFNGKKFSGGEW